MAAGNIDTPYVVSLDACRMYVFVRGTDGAIWLSSTSNGGSSWTGWSSLARESSTNITSSPSAIALESSNQLDVFVTGQNGTVSHKAWDGTNWWPSQTGWENLGGSFSPTIGAMDFPPQPVSWGPNRIDLFVLDGTGRVYHWTDRNGWGPSQTDWEDLGSP